MAKADLNSHVPHVQAGAPTEGNQKSPVPAAANAAAAAAAVSDEAKDVAGVPPVSPVPAGAPPVRTSDTALATDGAVKRLVTLEAIRRDPLVLAFVKRADAQLGVLGFTEHGLRHVSLVGNIARNVLHRLGYPDRACELAAIAGFLHDIGNCVNRRDHATAGALMAKDILLGHGMDPEELAAVMGAIGNHEETTGDPVGEISAALNIADKSDVHRSRVRETNPAKFDIHDRVNYASQHSFVRVDGDERRVELEMSIDTSIAPLMDYFEIFLNRMIFIRRAVQFLECEFRLTVNRNRIL